MQRGSLLKALACICALTACAQEAPNTERSGAKPTETGTARLTASTGLAAEFGHLAQLGPIEVKPEISDRITVYWADGWRQEYSPTAPTGWGSQEISKQVAAELLESDGLVLVEPGSAEGAQTAAPAVRLVLSQVGVDRIGRTYNPARDFMYQGLIGLAVGSAAKEEIYHSSYMLTLRAGMHARAMGPSECSIGLKTTAIDLQSGQTVAERPIVFGRETIETGVEHRTWNAMTSAERRTIQDHCLAALKEGISQALTGVVLID